MVDGMASETHHIDHTLSSALLKVYHHCMQKASSPPRTASNTQPSQLPVKSESSTMRGTQPTRSTEDAGPKEITNLNVSSKLPSVPVLASNPLADSQEQDSFQSPQAALPGTHPVVLLKSTAFLNQGDSEDTDSEVRHQLVKVPVACS